MVSYCRTDPSFCCGFSHRIVSISFLVLPVTDTGNIKMKYFNHWMKGRAAIEALEEEKRLKNDLSSHDLVQVPSSHDVVFRHGTSVQSHPGNVWYRDLLQSHCEKCSRGEVSVQDMLSLLVDDVGNQGGRFLEWSPKHSCWKVMQDPTQIRTKVYTSCYYLDKHHHARSKVQLSTSSTSMFEQQDGRKRKRSSERAQSDCCARGCL